MIKEKQEIVFPFYVKVAMVLVSLFILGYMAVLGKQVLSPLLYSMLFAMLLVPIANFFEKKVKLPRAAASGLAVLVLVTFIGTVLFFVGSQISDLVNDWPVFKQEFAASLNKLQHWIAGTFHVNMAKQFNFIHSATDNLVASSSNIISTTVLSVSSIVLFNVFVLIDTFLLLFYRSLIVRFLVSVFKEENANTVYDIISQVQFIIRRYILGLLLEMIIVAAAACIAFSIIGIRYPIFLGVITGIFNIVPYVGIFSALIFSTIISIGTAAGSTTILLVIITIVAIHLIDSNVLLPLIVGSQVKINALITLLGVILGEMFWGVSGMFLSIPVIAISKIIFDRIESLQPWGLLLGDEKDKGPNRRFSWKARRKKTKSLEQDELKKE